MKDVVFFFFSYSMLPYIFAYISFMLCNGRHKVKRNLNGLNNEKDYLYFTGVGKTHSGFHEVLFINIGFPMQEDLDVTKVLFFFQNETM